MNWLWRNSLCWRSADGVRARSTLGARRPLTCSMALPVKRDILGLALLSLPSSAVDRLAVEADTHSSPRTLDTLLGPPPEGLRGGAVPEGPDGLAAPCCCSCRFDLLALALSLSMNPLIVAEV